MDVSKIKSVLNTKKLLTILKAKVFNEQEIVPINDLNVSNTIITYIVKKYEYNNLSYIYSQNEVVAYENDNVIIDIKFFHTHIKIRVYKPKILIDMDYVLDLISINGILHYSFKQNIDDILTPINNEYI